MDDTLKPISNRTYCGLMWPDKGYPAYCCVLGEKPVAKSKTFDPQEGLEIYLERESKTLSDMFEFLGTLKDVRCGTICANLDRKYHSYIRELNKWRRESGSSLRLKATNSSSFEASIMKIKETILNNNLTFPEDSGVKSQLSIFAKHNLTDDAECYAVKALAMVIGEFTKRNQMDAAETVPDRRAWW